MINGTASSMVCLESRGEQPLEKRITEILQHAEGGLMEDGKGDLCKSFTMPQIEFLVKATGDWKSDTFDVRDCVQKLVREGKLKEEEYRFSWNKDVVSHESKCS